jgi:hypothetical protein
MEMTGEPGGVARANLAAWPGRTWRRGGADRGAPAGVRHSRGRSTRGAETTRSSATLAIEGYGPEVLRFLEMMLRDHATLRCVLAGVRGAVAEPAAVRGPVVDEDLVLHPGAPRGVAAAALAGPPARSAQRDHRRRRPGAQPYQVRAGRGRVRVQLGRWSGAPQPRWEDGRDVVPERRLPRDQRRAPGGKGGAGVRVEPTLGYTRLRGALGHTDVEAAYRTFGCWVLGAGCRVLGARNLRSTYV